MSCGHSGWRPAPTSTSSAGPSRRSRPGWRTCATGSTIRPRRLVTRRRTPVRRPGSGGSRRSGTRCWRGPGRCRGSRGSCVRPLRATCCGRPTRGRSSSSTRAHTGATRSSSPATACASSRCPTSTTRRPRHGPRNCCAPCGGCRPTTGPSRRSGRTTRYRCPGYRRHRRRERTRPPRRTPTWPGSARWPRSWPGCGTARPGRCSPRSATIGHRRPERRGRACGGAPPGR